MLENIQNFKINKYVGYRDYRDKLVILNTKVGVLYMLDGLEIKIWYGVINSKSIKDITSGIVAEYNIDSMVVKEDLEEFIQEMINEGLINEA